MPIINLQGITKIYRTKEVETVALKNVNLEVEKGDFLSVMGPSGCGKSTMLNIMGLLDTATDRKDYFHHNTVIHSVRIAASAGYPDNKPQRRYPAECVRIGRGCGRLQPVQVELLGIQNIQSGIITGSNIKNDPALLFQVIQFVPKYRRQLYIFQ
jgi:energy-coupling factor transporter ATP-binding protein EcfA2